MGVRPRRIRGGVPMSVTVTLTLPLIAGVIYLVGALMCSAAFVLDEMSFVNPSYAFAVLTGFAWPILVIQVVILAPVFDIYIGDVIRELRE